MDLRLFYQQLGGDYAQMLTRLPSEDMIRRFLIKFLRDPSYTDLLAALAAQDIPTAFRAAHTLKGTSATLGLDRLALAASSLTEALRGADGLPPQSLVDACTEAYQAAVDLISRLDS